MRWIIIIILICLCSLIISCLLYFLRSKPELAPVLVETPEPKIIESMKSKYKFDPNATKYNVQNAGFLCEASNASYEGDDICKKWAFDNGFTDSFHIIDTSKINPISGTYAYTAENKDVLLIVFRGTKFDNISNIITDINGIIKIPWGNLGTVHTGFYDAFFLAWNNFKELKNTIKNASINGKKIWITGHSLGGALAQMCAIQTELFEGIHVHSIYTYGQPRIGDFIFSQNINTKMGNRMFRIVNNFDIVPRLAPFSVGYRQHGRELYYDRSKKVTEKDASVEDATDAVMSILSSFNKTISFSELLKIPIEKGPLFMKSLEQGVDIKKIVDENKQQVIDHRMTTGYVPLFEKIE